MAAQLGGEPLLVEYHLLGRDRLLFADQVEDKFWVAVRKSTKVLYVLCAVSTWIIARIPVERVRSYHKAP